jgi:hypothetical protein
MADESSKKRVTVIIESDVDRRLKVFCAAKGMTKNDAVGLALTSFLRDKKGEVAQTLQDMATAAAAF